MFNNIVTWHVAVNGTEIVRKMTVDRFLRMFRFHAVAEMRRRGL